MVISHKFHCLCVKNICFSRVVFFQKMPLGVQKNLPAVLPADYLRYIYTDLVHSVIRKPGTIQTA